MKIRAFVLWAVSTLSLSAAKPDQAAQAVNALGLDLHRQMPREGNVCLSPYSVQSALAMTYVGASGATQEEMARVLHFPADKEALGESFAALRLALDEAQKASVVAVARGKDYGGPAEAITLRVANRLFGQSGHEFRPPFLAEVKEHFDAPLQTLNFRKNPAGARSEINGWVAQQTRERIRDLIPPAGLNKDTRLVLVNSLYFKAAWSDEFSQKLTAPRPFHVAGRKETVMVPTMRTQDGMGYMKGRGFQAVTLDYAGNGLHFLLIIPDGINDIASVEARLTPKVLQACAKADVREVHLFLPKFKITPPTVALGEVLQRMGLTTAFDQPPGSADFDAMAPKRPDSYLCISKVFHKTFLALDEKGTEAAAATAVSMMETGGMSSRPIDVIVDRPFLFAIQHAASGACLFLGRVTDPR